MLLSLKLQAPLSTWRSYRTNSSSSDQSTGSDCSTDCSADCEACSFYNLFASAVESLCDSVHCLSRLYRQRRSWSRVPCNCTFAINCTASIFCPCEYIGCQTSSRHEPEEVCLQNK